MAIYCCWKRNRFLRYSLKKPTPKMFKKLKTKSVILQLLLILALRNEFNYLSLNYINC